MKLDEIVVLKNELNGLVELNDEEIESRSMETVYKSYIGDQNIEIVVPELIDNMIALLFLDGIDEVPVSARKRLNRGLEKLSSRLKYSRIISSCRTGDFTILEGFDTVSICKLDSERIKQIIDLWLGNSTSFIKDLNAVPYKDLANRPLFLTYLLAIYANIGELPSQPCDVYRRIIWLVIKEWDEQRKVKRESKYASFYEERKLEFLSSIAFELTYRQRKTSFSSDDLELAFEQIKDSFGFENIAPQKVVSEIEEHTGLINQAGYKSYEFSHSSLQEYLTAYYLVRASLTDAISEYLDSYPAPLAVAAAISSDPSEWLTGVLLSSSGLKASSFSIKSLYSGIIGM